MSHVIPPAGTVPFSAFIPHPYTPAGAPPVILADAIDPYTGEFSSLEDSYDPADGAVVVTCRTKRGSGGAVMEIGHLFDFERVDDQSKALLLAEGRQMFRRLIDAKEIELTLLTAEADPNNDYGILYAQWRNLQSGDSAPKSIPVRVT